MILDFSNFNTIKKDKKLYTQIMKEYNIYFMKHSNDVLNTEILDVTKMIEKYKV